VRDLHYHCWRSIDAVIRLLLDLAVNAGAELAAGIAFECVQKLLLGFVRWLIVE
jgi:hypothetical protein